MSDYVPFQIQMEIIERLPVKSLLKFRCVSKQWNSSIDSSEFIAGYRVRKNHPERQIVWYIDPVVPNEQRFVSFVDDTTFALQEFNSIVPVLIKQLKFSRMVLSSQGLLCVHGYTPDQGHFDYNSLYVTMPRIGMAVLWNPCIRKSVGVVVTGAGEIVVGFGVCPTNNDPTIVKFTHPVYMRKQSSTKVPWVVEVFSLNSGTWRIPSGKPPDGKIEFRVYQVVIDKFIYWHSCDGVPFGGISTKNQITSYDMTTEEIGGIELPASLAHNPSFCLTISKVRESLAMLESDAYTNTKVCVVWMMDRDVPNMFTKLFTINTPRSNVCICTLGFNNNGEPYSVYAR